MPERLGEDRAHPVEMTFLDAADVDDADGFRAGGRRAADPSQRQPAEVVQQHVGGRVLEGLPVGEAAALPLEPPGDLLARLLPEPGDGVLDRILARGQGRSANSP